ncbi:hypothetical protein RBA04_22600, partial [Mycobacteroides abscessus subsp. massiliense]|uniref:hypothetical protein n=1 Tax=Mycobacteroides abscessus TaxID=36809 RepID=UPI003CEE31D6
KFAREIFFLGRPYTAALALTELLSEAQSDEGESTIHDDPLVARFYGLLEAEFATDASLPEEVRVDIVHLAQEIVVQVEANASMVRFWHNPHAQETLRKQLIHTLDDRD